MQKLKYFSIALLLTLFSTTVNAQTLLQKKFTTLKSSPVVLSIHIFTDHPFADSFSFTEYTGTSKTAPCSDLEVRGSGSEPKAYFDDITVDITSGDILEGEGKEITCLKSEITLDKTGHVYSTGNIQLSWDKNTQLFTATPDKVSMDVSKE